MVWNANAGFTGGLARKLIRSNIVVAHGLSDVCKKNAISVRTQEATTHAYRSNMVGEACDAAVEAVVVWETQTAIL